MDWLLYGIAGFQVFGALCTIALVGRPRKPITPGLALWTTLVVAFIATVLILAARQLN